MLLCGQTYLTIFENKKLKYLVFLKETGLKFLFENIFVEEIDNWMKYVGKAYNYKQLFCLPHDWKKPKTQDNNGNGGEEKKRW